MYFGRAATSRCKSATFRSSDCNRVTCSMSAVIDMINGNTRCAYTTGKRRHATPLVKHAYTSERFAVLGPDAAKQSGLHFHRHYRAGTRNRREHRHLQRRECGTAARARVRPSGPPGDVVPAAAVQGHPEDAVCGGGLSGNPRSEPFVLANGAILHG